VQQKKNIVMPYPSVDPDIFNGKTVRSKSPAQGRTHLLFYRGGNHGECMAIRGALNSLVRASSFRRNVHRAQGYLSAVFCPVPVGDSPSSKRMYDAMNLGCVPVLLSDDAVWAYSKLTGGTLRPPLFSVRLPQKIVLCTTADLLSCLGVSEGDIHEHPYSNRLPGTGTTVGQIVLEISRDAVAASDSAGYMDQAPTPNTTAVNALVEFLRRIPITDVTALQRGVKTFSSAFRYYQYNSSITHIPISHHMYPDGGAISHMAWRLSKLKRDGIATVGTQCQEERLRKGHEYIGNYPCEVKGNNKKQNKTRNRRHRLQKLRQARIDAE